MLTLDLRSASMGSLGEHGVLLQAQSPHKMLTETTCPTPHPQERARRVAAWEQESGSLGEHGMLLEAEQAAELQPHRAQLVHVDLQRVRKVDEHEGLALLPAHHVQAGCRHLHMHTMVGGITQCSRQTSRLSKTLGQSEVVKYSCHILHD